MNEIEKSLLRRAGVPVIIVLPPFLIGRSIGTLIGRAWIADDDAGRVLRVAGRRLHRQAPTPLALVRSATAVERPGERRSAA